jgi:RHS repeat-associated protein
VLSKDNFSAFGESSSLTADRFGYTAQRFDAESGQYYYRARYYSPATGRFIQPDPIGYSGGLNLYGYVENNPISNVDPLGQDLLGAAVGAGLGLPAGVVVGATVGGALGVGTGVSTGGITLPITVPGGVVGGALVGGGLGIVGGAAVGSHWDLGQQIVQEVSGATQIVGASAQDFILYASGKKGKENVADTGVEAAVRELVGQGMTEEEAFKQLRKNATGKQRQKINATEKDWEKRNKAKRCQ